ncbi:non-specific phospholipase C1 [Olea europaea subsp. europaea]|uniref:Non-specific phospholipase C1 n=1 Tax=Olea europaea subsp. europaea TaxID=158383 RepID=A0A8S0U834_OLEEU|nr:non-specific phospholipase C1 [Olea europaea subsp. europaea]
MKNPSFDHMLGWLKSSRPDINGLSGFEFNWVNAFDFGSTPIFGSNDMSSNPTLMNDFVQQAKAMGVDGLSKIVMSGFKLDLVPVYTELVNEFTVMDRWFASVPASTQPNRFYVHSATSHGASSNVRSDGAVLSRV